MNRKRWLQWSRELVAAVALCHDRGVLHADIKPQNIMVRSCPLSLEGLSCRTRR
jgi:serine/threonine protein kinase